MKNYKKMYHRLKYKHIFDKNTGKNINKIRKLVNFNHDLRLTNDHFNKNLSRAEKQAITHYHNIFFGDKNSAAHQGLINDDVYLYRPHSKKNKKIAIKYAGIKGSYKDLNVIPIPRADPKNKLDLVFKNNKLIVKEKNISRTTAYFNMQKLAENPEKEIKRVYDLLENKDAVQLIAGLREILNQSAIGINAVQSQVISKMQKYDNYSQWLLGLVGYEFLEQDNYINYIQDRNKTQKRKRLKKCKLCKKRNLQTKIEKAKGTCKICLNKKEK